MDPPPPMPDRLSGWSHPLPWGFPFSGRRHAVWDFKYYVIAQILSFDGPVDRITLLFAADPSLDRCEIDRAAILSLSETFLLEYLQVGHHVGDATKESFALKFWKELAGDLVGRSSASLQDMVDGPLPPFDKG